jgi:hypothetical protein
MFGSEWDEMKRELRKIYNEEFKSTPQQMLFG